MAMKKNIFIFLLTIFVFDIYAYVLPDGTDARIIDLHKENGVLKSVFLAEPTELNTPLGKVNALDEVSFYSNGNIKNLEANEEGVLETPVGKISYTNIISLFSSNLSVFHYSYFVYKRELYRRF